MYNAIAKHRVAPENLVSRQSGFALNVFEINTGEVFVSNVVKKCKMHGDLSINQTYKLKESYTCKECIRDQNKKKYIKYREKRLKEASEYRINNREKLRLWIKNDRAENKEKYSEQEKAGYKGRTYTKSLHEILRKRNIPEEQYTQMIVDQDNKCYICNLPETCKDPKNDWVRRLSIDHCHKTGKSRKLLCHSCNIILGKSKDSIEILQSAIFYLMEFSDIEDDKG
jgi:superfamily II DNA helicase RecQ